MASADPYYLVREEIQDSVTKIQTGYDRWERLPQGSESRATIAHDLVNECDSVIWQLDELDRATELAEKDFARFRIERSELASRRSWNTNTRAQVNALKDAMAAAARERKTGAKHAGGRSTTTSKLDNAITSQNDSFVNNQSDQQALLIRQQDQDLDELSESVARLGQVGRTIGEELDTQGKLLDELEEDVDGTTTRLGAAQKKLVQVIKRSGMGGQMAIVGVLLIILVVLVVFTFH